MITLWYNNHAGKLLISQYSNRVYGIYTGRYTPLIWLINHDADDWDLDDKDEFEIWIRMYYEK